jgi:hypothetical protein
MRLNMSTISIIGAGTMATAIGLPTPGIPSRWSTATPPTAGGLASRPWRRRWGALRYLWRSGVWFGRTFDFALTISKGAPASRASVAYGNVAVSTRATAIAKLPHIVIDS